MFGEIVPLFSLFVVPLLPPSPIFSREQVSNCMHTISLKFTTEPLTTTHSGHFIHPDSKNTPHCACGRNESRSPLPSSQRCTIMYVYPPPPPPPSLRPTPPSPTHLNTPSTPHTTLTSITHHFEFLPPPPPPPPPKLPLLSHHIYNHHQQHPLPTPITITPPPNLKLLTKQRPVGRRPLPK